MTRWTQNLRPAMNMRKFFDICLPKRENKQTIFHSNRFLFHTNHCKTCVCVCVFKLFSLCNTNLLNLNRGWKRKKKMPGKFCTHLKVNGKRKANLCNKIKLFNYNICDTLHCIFEVFEYVMMLFSVLSFGVSLFQIRVLINFWCVCVFVFSCKTERRHKLIVEGNF